MIVNAELSSSVSVLFNEPKLLKSIIGAVIRKPEAGFSALQRAEIAEIGHLVQFVDEQDAVSVLFNEPKLLKLRIGAGCAAWRTVSVLFNEPKLLKSLEPVSSWNV